MEFSMGIPLIGTVRMANALVTGLLIGKSRKRGFCTCVCVCVYPSTQSPAD